MFAFFTKIAWLAVQPSSLIAMALLAALWQAWQGRTSAVRRWLTGATAAYLIAGYTALGDGLIIPLENRFSRPNLDSAGIAGQITGQ